MPVIVRQMGELIDDLPDAFETAIDEYSSWREKTGPDSKRHFADVDDLKTETDLSDELDDTVDTESVINFALPV